MDALTNDVLYFKWIFKVNVMKVATSFFKFKNVNSAMNYSPSCRSKPIRFLFIFGTQIKIFWWNLRAFWPCIDRNITTTSKTQKGSKDIIKIVHVTRAVVKSTFAESEVRVQDQKVRVQVKSKSKWDSQTEKEKIIFFKTCTVGARHITQLCIYQATNGNVRSRWS